MATVDVNGLKVKFQSTPVTSVHDLVDVVLGDDVIKHDPQSAEQVDDLQRTELGDERRKVVEVGEVD